MIFRNLYIKTLVKRTPETFYRKILFQFFNIKNSCLINVLLVVSMKLFVKFVSTPIFQCTKPLNTIFV